MADSFLNIDRSEVDTILRKLRQRNFNAFYCGSRQEAIDKCMEIIPDGSTITWGGSATIRDIGLTERLKNGPYVVYDRDEAADNDTRNDIYRKAFGCDYYLSSVNAMSRDGIVVNIDGNGNRVAAITWGPRNVIYVIGVNKICNSVEDAVRRARKVAAPRNQLRFRRNTPCSADGECHDCKSDDCICNYFFIQRMSSPKGRHTVILVGEELGY